MGNNSAVQLYDFTKIKCLNAKNDLEKSSMFPEDFTVAVQRRFVAKFKLV